MTKLTLREYYIGLCELQEDERQMNQTDVAALLLDIEYAEDWIKRVTELLAVKTMELQSLNAALDKHNELQGDKGESY
jgi:hypothetical protein